MQAPGAPLGIILKVLTNPGRDGMEMLAHLIVAGLDQAGYEIRRKPDLIPIRPNPGPLPARSVPVAGPKP
jgi:hypothetical protein